MVRSRSLISGLAISLFSVTALAGPQCTKEPKEKWMPEADMKAKIDAQGYKVKVFKVTSGSCYEIYGTDKNGKKVEIYFSPMDGSVVKQR